MTFDKDIAGQNHDRDEIGIFWQLIHGIDRCEKTMCVLCDISSDQDIVTGSKLPQRIQHVIINPMSLSILVSWSWLLTEKSHVKRHDRALSNGGNIVCEMVGAKNSVKQR